MKNPAYKSTVSSLFQRNEASGSVSSKWICYLYDISSLPRISNFWIMKFIYKQDSKTQKNRKLVNYMFKQIFFATIVHVYRNTVQEKHVVVGSSPAWLYWLYICLLEDKSSDSLLCFLYFQVEGIVQYSDKLHDIVNSVPGLSQYPTTLCKCNVFVLSFTFVILKLFESMFRLFYVLFISLEVMLTVKLEFYLRQHLPEKKLLNID